MSKSITEAATIKARARGLLRDANRMMQDKKLPKAIADALTSVRSALTSTWSDLAAQESAGRPITESAGVAQWLESRLHSQFTYICDDLYGDGLLTREERVQLSNAIGDALDAFTTNIVANAPQLYDRGRWEEPKEQPADVGMQASESGELTSEAVPLTEAATGGNIPIKIIAPGWGSSGYYSAEVLKRDGPKAFKAGLHMYVDHPTPQEEASRPERSLKDLAAVLASDAQWMENGKAGPGLYATAKVFGDHAASIAERGKSIGVSIRALGQARAGEAEGRKGPIIEAITTGKSVDFVTLPGAGGAVLTESRTVIQPPVQEVTEAKNTMTEQEQKELSEAKAETARLREALLLREAADFVNTSLATAKLPDLTKARLAESLSKSPVHKDGMLDKDAYKAKIDEAVKAEADYLAKLGNGRIAGLGGGNDAPAFSEAGLVESFKALGLSESAAKLAAQGR
jgi:hypothetical protein